MGVADGVYSWKEVGIDSGAMSRALVETAEHMVQAGYEDVVKSGWRGYTERLRAACMLRACCLHASRRTYLVCMTIRCT
jgi:hypothetical protein